MEKMEALHIFSKFKEELDLLGLWEYAIFVILLTPNITGHTKEMVEDEIFDMVAKHIGLDTPKLFEEKEKFAINTLKLPARIFSKARVNIYNIYIIINIFLHKIDVGIPLYV